MLAHPHVCVNRRWHTNVLYVLLTQSEPAHVDTGIEVLWKWSMFSWGKVHAQSTFAAANRWFPGAQTHLCLLPNTISSSCFTGVLHKLHRFCQLWGDGGWKAIPTVHPEYWDRQDQLQHLLHSWSLPSQSQAEDCSENGPCWHLHQHEQAHNFLWGHTARRCTNILDVTIQRAQACTWSLPELHSAAAHKSTRGFYNPATKKIDPEQFISLCGYRKSKVACDLHGDMYWKGSWQSIVSKKGWNVLSCLSVSNNTELTFFCSVVLTRGLWWEWCGFPAFMLH